MCRAILDFEYFEYSVKGKEVGLVRKLLILFAIDAQLKPIFYSYLGKIFKWEAYFKEKRHSDEHRAGSGAVVHGD
jgi:hypothetical protein